MGILSLITDVLKVICFLAIIISVLRNKCIIIENKASLFKNIKGHNDTTSKI